MNSVFTLWGEIKLETGTFKSELLAANASLKATKESFDEVETGARSLGSNLSQLGGMLTAGITVPLIGIGAASFKLAVDFQQQMTYIRTQAGDTTDSIADLSKQVLELSKNSQFGPVALAKSLYDLVSVGMRGADAMNALNAAQKLASVGGSDLEKTTSAIAGVLVTQIKGTEDYTRAAGLMNAIVGVGKMRMSDLVSAMGTGAIPVFKQAGLSLAEFGTVLADLTDNNIGAASAATRLRMTIALMEAPVPKAVNALKSIGMTSDQLASDMRSKGLIPALQDLKSHLETTFGTSPDGLNQTAAALDHMFGGGRSSAVIKLLLNDLDRLPGKFKQIGDNADTFGEDFAEQQETAAGRIKVAWAKIQTVGEELGERILPPVAAILSQISQAILTVSDAFLKLSPTMQTVVGMFAGIAVVAGPLLLIVGSVATAIAAVAAAASVITSIVAALGGMATVAPILAAVGLAFAMLAADIVTLYLAWQANFGGIRDFVQQVGDSMKTSWNDTMTNLTALTNQALSEIKTFWDQNGADIMVAVNKVSEAIRLTWTVVLDFWKANGDNIKAVTAAVWSAVGDIVIGSLKIVLEAIKGIAAVINGDWTTAFGSLNKIVQISFEMMVQAVIAGGVAILAAFKVAWNAVWALDGWIRAQATKLGTALGEGIKAGIHSMVKIVSDEVSSLAQAAVTAAKSVLQIQSPSKVFFGIGQDTAKGFIDGIASMQTGVHAGMARMLDLSNLKITLGKGDEGGVSLLTQLIHELDDLTPRTRLEELQAQLTGKAYENLNNAVKDRILLAGYQIDLAKRMKTALNAEIPDIVGNQGHEETQGTGTSLGSINAWTRFSQSLPSASDFADGPPKLKAAWEDFWGTMRLRMGQFKETLPSFKVAIGDNLVGAMKGFADVFAEAIQQNDGTFKGFFTSVLTGFKNLVEGILSQLMRLAVSKLLMSLLGGILGGDGLDMSDAGDASTNISEWFGGLPGHAMGGAIPSGQWSVVGERGPELFFSGGGGQMTSNSNSKGMLGGSTFVVHNHFHADKDTGAFNKKSAMQAARDTSMYLERAHQA